MVKKGPIYKIILIFRLSHKVLKTHSKSICIVGMRGNMPEKFQEIGIKNNFRIKHIIVKETISNKNPLEYILIFEKS